MRVSTMVRATLLGAAAAVMAACGDATTAPSSAVAPSAPAMAAGGNGNGNGNGLATAPGQNGSYTQTITVDPTQTNSWWSGGSGVTIPANSICDPAKSIYAASQWNKSCALATKPFRLKVELTVVGGQTTIQFTPDLRFAPAPDNDPSRWVILTLKQQGNLDAAKGYAILWYDQTKQTWIDESKTDPTLYTWRAPANSLARRLKHFSGYTIGAFTCDQNAEMPDPACQQ